MATMKEPPRQHVELTDLLGTRVLDGIDREVVAHTGDRDTKTVVRMRLNGIVLQFEEDPDDGYRSCLGEVYIVPNGKVVAFEPVIVTIELGDKPDDTLRFRESMRGRRLLARIGTDHSDDYYPSFVFEWTPVDAMPRLPS